jgi:hypothetical protein
MPHCEIDVKHILIFFAQQLVFFPHIGKAPPSTFDGGNRYGEVILL